MQAATWTGSVFMDLGGEVGAGNKLAAPSETQSLPLLLRRIGKSTEQGSTFSVGDWSPKRQSSGSELTKPSDCNSQAPPWTMQTTSSKPTRQALMAALVSSSAASSSSRPAPQLSGRSVVEVALDRAHHTHQLAKCVASGSYICLKCGAMTAGAVMCKLAKPCQRPTKSGLRELARIAKGQGLRVGDRHRKA